MTVRPEEQSYATARPVVLVPAPGRCVVACAGKFLSEISNPRLESCPHYDSVDPSHLWCEFFRAGGCLKGQLRVPVDPETGNGPMATPARMLVSADRPHPGIPVEKRRLFPTVITNCAPLMQGGTVQAGAPFLPP